MTDQNATCTGCGTPHVHSTEVTHLIAYAGGRLCPECRKVVSKALEARRQKMRRNWFLTGVRTVENLTRKDRPPEHGAEGDPRETKVQPETQVTTEASRPVREREPTTSEGRSLPKRPRKKR